MADWSDWSAGLGRTWDADDSNAALREGWDIFDTGGAEGHDDFEIQYVQAPQDFEPGFLPYSEPVFKDDVEAWLHVRSLAWGGSKLHYRALRFLEVHAPEEFDKIVNWKDR